MNAEGFFQHDPAAEVKRKVPPEIWNDYFKFSITRNPWDRVVSNFSWEARNRLSSEADPALVSSPWDCRSTSFARRRSCSGSSSAGDWTTNDRFYVLDGALCVDFVIRYEHLERGSGRGVSAGWLAAGCAAAPEGGAAAGRAFVHRVL